MSQLTLQLTDYTYEDIFKKNSLNNRQYLFIFWCGSVEIDDFGMWNGHSTVLALAIPEELQQ